MKRIVACCTSGRWTCSGRRSRGSMRRSARPMASAGMPPITAAATPPFSAKLSRTRVRSRRSSSSLMERTAMKAISPPLMASNAGGRVRSEVAHSTRRSRPAPPPTSSRCGGSALRQTSLTVITSRSRSFQVLINLPGGHLGAVLLPLQDLDLEEALRQGVTEGVEDHLIRLECRDGVLEVVGEKTDVPSLQLDLVEPVQRLLHGGRQGKTPLDPVQAAAEHDREGEIRVARGVGAAQLDPRRLGPRDVRHPDQCTDRKSV